MQNSLTKKIPLVLEQGLFSGTAFMTNIALVKLLDLEQYGIHASLILVSHFLLGFCQALVIQPLQVHISKSGSVSSYKFFVLFITCSLIFIFDLLILFTELADLTWLSLGQLCFFPFALYVTVFLLADFYRKFFLATGRVIVALGITFMYSVSTAALFAFSFFYYPSGDLSFYFYLMAGGYFLPLAAATIVYCRDLTFPSREATRKYLKIHLTDGQWLLYASVVQWLSGNLYVMASGVLIGVEALGVLRFVQSLFGLINIVLQTIENYVLPQLSRAYQRSVQHCYQAFQRTLTGLQLAVLAGLLLLFFFAEDVIRITGNAEFVPYAYVLRGMAVLYAIIIIAYPVRLFVRITELNKSYFAAYLISFLFSLVSYHFFLSHFGVLGAVSGLIINQLILQATWLVVLHKNQFQVWRLYTS